MLCTKCGKELNDNVIFCSACGNRVKEAEETLNSEAIEEEKIFRRKEIMIPLLKAILPVRTSRERRRVKKVLL